MAGILFLLMASFLAGALAQEEEPLQAPRPLRDRFRLIQSGISSEALSDEVKDFTSYTCEQMVVIRNDAKDSFRLACASHNESPKTAVIAVGRSYVFTFRPRRDGQTVFWCTVDYPRAWARFDVYNGKTGLNSCGGENGARVQEFVVKHDGVYANGGDQKIRSLLKGHNRYTLWEKYEDGQTDGMLLTGLVDGGECADLPLHANDRTAAVNVCDHNCIHVFEHFGCQGATQTIRATESCIDAPLEEQLGGKLSAVKGC